MKLFVKYEIIAMFVLPFLLAILKRRGAVTEKQIVLSIVSLLSLLAGSIYLSIGNPETLSSASLEDWLVAVGLLLFMWVLTYPFGRWLLKQWFQS